jgi:hypothetical protein
MFSAASRFTDTWPTPANEGSCSSSCSSFPSAEAKASFCDTAREFEGVRGGASAALPTGVLCCSSSSLRTGS